MAPRRAAPLLVALVAAAAILTLNCAFVPPPAGQLQIASDTTATPIILPASSAMLGAAVAAVPQEAFAANQGYAVLQLGWAVFIIGLGPAVLFWIYFNRPELL